MQSMLVNSNVISILPFFVKGYDRIEVHRVEATYHRAAQLYLPVAEESIWWAAKAIT